MKNYDDLKELITDHSVLKTIIEEETEFQSEIHSAMDMFVTGRLSGYDYQDSLDKMSEILNDKFLNTVKQEIVEIESKINRVIKGTVMMYPDLESIWIGSDSLKCKVTAIANEYSTKDEYPVEVVYQCSDFNTYCVPASEFLDKFTKSPYMVLDVTCPDSNCPESLKIKADLPTINTKWVHPNGCAYRVIGIANTTSNALPNKIIYQGLSNNRIWSKPTKNFMSKMKTLPA